MRNRRSDAGHRWEALADVYSILKPRRNILLVGFFLMAINRASGLILPASTKYLIDDVIGKREIHLLAPLLLIVIAATALQAGTSYGLTQLLSKSGLKVIADLRVKVHAHIAYLPLAFYDANKTGSLLSRIMNDVEGIRNLMGPGLISVVGGIMTAIFAAIVLLRIDLVMTIVVLIVFVVFGFAMTKSLKVIRPIFRARPKINAEVTGRLAESLSGIRVVKGYHAEQHEQTVFATGVQRLLDNSLQALTSISLATLVATCLMGTAGAAIMLLGTHEILLGYMTLGTFITYTIFLAMLIAPVSQVVTVGPQLTEALAGIERVREILNEPTELGITHRTITVSRIKGSVSFEGVNFSYDRNKPVLRDINFKSESGMATALVGPSGAGKSTIIGLIAAFYSPTSGRILLDGLDLTQVRLDSYRTQLGIVLQDPFLFDGTIRENVAFARPAAGEREILSACHIACVDEFVTSLDKGYGTFVGERGVKLSGGQKQRISIARAILADPRILILDEATSSLDSESEAFIQEGLRYLMRGRTTFVIAHRLSTTRQADQILVLEGGSIIERGRHETLYATQGRYYSLYTKQYGLESNILLGGGEKGESQASEVRAGELDNTDQRQSLLSTAIKLIRGGGTP